MSQSLTVFVVGATGAVGPRAVARLLDAGHTVRAGVRSEARAEAARAVGAEPVVIDLFDPDTMVGPFAGADAVVNLATRIPPPARAALGRAWKENDRIRQQGSAALAEAARRAEVARYVQESICFVYSDGGDRWLDEDAPVEGGSVASALDAEAQATRFTEHGGVGVALRFGLFYGAHSAHTEAAVASARRRFSPVIGAPDAYQPALHLDDAAGAVLAALAAPAGLYNVVDDEPLTKAEYGAALAGALGVKPPRMVPQLAVRALGKRVAPIARSQRVANARFRKATGWAPAHPSVREGWPAVVAATQAPEAEEEVGAGG